MKEKPFEVGTSLSSLRGGGVEILSDGSSGTLDSTLLLIVVELDVMGGGNARLGGLLIGGFVLSFSSASLAARTDFLCSSVSSTPGKKTYSNMSRGVTAMA